MEGVTTAIVAFIFACLVWPHLVKNKPQFYSALGMVLVVILFDAIGHMEKVPGALHAVMYVLAALVQIVTILLLVLCVGGLTVRELAGNVADTVHVIRHGEDKPVWTRSRSTLRLANWSHTSMKLRRQRLPRRINVGRILTSA